MAMTTSSPPTVSTTGRWPGVKQSLKTLPPSRCGRNPGTCRASRARASSRSRASMASGSSGPRSQSGEVMLKIQWPPGAARSGRRRHRAVEDPGARREDRLGGGDPAAVGGDQFDAPARTAYVGDPEALQERVVRAAEDLVEKPVGEPLGLTHRHGICGQQDLVVVVGQPGERPVEQGPLLPGDRAGAAAVGHGRVERGRVLARHQPADVDRRASGVAESGGELVEECGAAGGQGALGRVVPRGRVEPGRQTGRARPPSGVRDHGDAAARVPAHGVVRGEGADRARADDGEVVVGRPAGPGGALTHRAPTTRRSR